MVKACSSRIRYYHIAYFIILQPTDCPFNIWTLNYKT